MGNLVIVLLGVASIFASLVCIVILFYVIEGFIQKRKERDTSDTAVTAPNVTEAKPASSAPIADRQKIIAAACAVIAEELGEDVRNLKVVSFKRI